MKYAVIFLLFFLTTCEKDDDGIICTTEFVYGLHITVKNANTNAIVVDGITVIARDGNYEEELININGSNNFIGAGERAGNYIIEITSNNFQTFTSETIVVGKDECHVIPEILEVLLQPN